MNDIQSRSVHASLVYHVLVQARDYLDHGRAFPVDGTHENGWIQNADARGWDGNPVSAFGHHAFAWSMDGALKRAASLRRNKRYLLSSVREIDDLDTLERNLYETAVNLVENVIRDNIITWNNNQDCGILKVLNAMDSAIEQAWKIVIAEEQKGQRARKTLAQLIYESGCTIQGE